MRMSPIRLAVSALPAEFRSSSANANAWADAGRFHQALQSNPHGLVVIYDCNQLSFELRRQKSKLSGGSNRAIIPSYISFISACSAANGGLALHVETPTSCASSVFRAHR